MYNKISDLNFNEITAYYEQHSKADTCSHFNISISSFSRACKKYNYRKPQELINKLREDTVSNTPDIWIKRNLKTIETQTAKYGSVSQAHKEANIKSRQAKLEKYGDPNYNNRDKYKITCKEKFGYENPFQAEDIKKLCNTEAAIDKANKSRLKTFNEKYGVDYVGNLEQSHQNYTYKYENTFFDSSWELALWIYAKDHNKAIERLPISINFEAEGKTHTYTPDFLYDDKLIEIKGNQFLDENNCLINPYRTEKFNSIKMDIIKEYNIIIWSYAEIKPYLNYITATYGKDYLKQFKQ